MLYNKFSDYLKNKYSSKVYKIPVNLPVTCPNRCKGGGGCIFCGEEGAGFELLSQEMSIKDQISKNSKYIGENYNASKFIIYFQNYSNTFLSKNDFIKYLNETIEAAREYNVVAIYISTRPDCIRDSYLEILKEISLENNIDIVIELGLQTANYNTLNLLNRGHSLAEFIDAVLRIKRHGMQICAHTILDLPFDSLVDVEETAKIISSLSIEQVKCHSMFILEGTVLGNMYKAGEIAPLSVEDFVNRSVVFLEYLNPQIVIQRLVGRAPIERTLYCNGGMSWWKIQDMIINKLEEKKSRQGIHFNYLNGRALEIFD